MYEFKDFGAKIEKARKTKGLTQEDLATKLGITSQAVSKWENGNSYPDITLLPDICAILGISLDELFGKKADITEEINFPKNYKGLMFITSFKEIGCYSDKSVEKVDDSSVTFADGSIAELANSRVINKGKGEIRFYTVEKKLQAEKEKKKPSDTNKSYSFGKFKNLNVNMSVGEYRIISSDSGETKIEITGSPEFVECVSAEAAGDTLNLKFNNPDNYNFNLNRGNKLLLSLAHDGLDVFDTSINGSGDVIMEIDAASGKLRINGSGDIKTCSFADTTVNINGSGDVGIGDAGKCAVRINGSGDVDMKKAGELSVNINGSGDVSADSCTSVSIAVGGSGDVSLGRVSDKVNAVIRGSGDISIGGGEVASFEVEINGSGDINAENLTADRAKIKIDAGGSVKLGWVKYESIEHCSKHADVIIKRRGI